MAKAKTMRQKAIYLCAALILIGIVIRFKPFATLIGVSYEYIYWAGNMCCLILACTIPLFLGNNLEKLLSILCTGVMVSNLIDGFWFNQVAFQANDYIVYAISIAAAVFYFLTTDRKMQIKLSSLFLLLIIPAKLLTLNTSILQVIEPGQYRYLMNIGDAAVYLLIALFFIRYMIKIQVDLSVIFITLSVFNFINFSFGNPYRYSILETYMLVIMVLMLLLRVVFLNPMRFKSGA
jgi:hypothetical protein